MVKDGADQPVLFDPGEPRQPGWGEAAGGGRPRMRFANRQQVEFRACSLDDLIPQDAQVRVVWAYVEGLDLSPLLERIRAVEGHAGAPPADPRILTALWLYATLRGVGSARELARRCDPQRGEVPFQWIAGGVSMNYHTLSDSRVEHNLQATGEHRRVRQRHRPQPRPAAVPRARRPQSPGGPVVVRSGP
jgi:transposase